MGAGLVRNLRYPIPRKLEAVDKGPEEEKGLQRDQCEVASAKIDNNAHGLKHGLLLLLGL